MLTLQKGSLSLEGVVEGRLPIDKADIHDVITPLHLTGTHLVAVASKNQLFILTQVPSSNFGPSRLLLLKRIPFTDVIRAVRWIPGKEEVLLLVVFDTFLLFLGDDWRVWGSLELPNGEALRSVDSGPIALDQNFFLIVNTTSASRLYKVMVKQELESCILLDLSFNGEALQFGDYLGLDAFRGNEFYFYDGAKWESSVY